MLDGVIHNAALRMEADGVGLEDLLMPRHGVRRWFGRGGAAVGGAASLAIGAVLGGAFEGIPILMPPPVAAASVPQAVSGLPASTPWALAAGQLSGTGLPPVSSPASLPITLRGGTVIPTPPGGGNNPPPPGHTPPTGDNPPGPCTTNCSNTGDKNPPPPPCTVNCGGGGGNPTLLDTVAGTVSKLPAVGPVVAPVVSGVATTVTPVLGGGASTSSSSSPVGGVTSTVTTTVSTVTGALGGLLP
jgi:hypothetical protein